MADEDAFFHRLDVDVARLALDRAFHDEIDEVDDRRRLAALLEARDRLEDFFFRPAGERRLACRLSRHPARARRRGRRRHGEVRTGLVRAHQRFVGVAGLDRVDDVGARRHDLLDAVAGLELEILHEAEEQRVGHRDRQQVLLEPDRDADALERDFLRNEHHRVDRAVLGQVDVGEPELERERLGDLFLSGEIHPHQHDAQPLAGALVLGQSGPQVAFCDEACLNQALTDFLAHPEFTLTGC